MRSGDSDFDAQEKKRNDRALRLRIRILVYLCIVLLIALVRILPNWRVQLPRIGSWSSDARSLSVSGQSLAPELIGKVVSDYGQRYPDLEIRQLPGGTAQALEALVNRRSDVAFLSRRPSTEEQQVIRQALGDTLTVFPVALGGIVLLVGSESPIDSLEVEDLSRFLGAPDASSASPEARPNAGPNTGPGTNPARLERLYLPDPNLGLWGALVAHFGLPPSAVSAPSWPGVLFLQDEEAVREAVRRDPLGVGVASSLSLPPGLSTVTVPAPTTGDAAPPGAAIAQGLRVVSVRGSLGSGSMTPGEDEIATGDYPLHHYLYVSCRPDGGIQGSMFVTHLFSGRGQRTVKRLGFLPAREVAREIVLTTDPIGTSK